MKIDWSEPAIQDLDAIWSYIAKDSKYYAAEFTAKIFESVEGLTPFPSRGRRTPESEDPNVRELLFQNYRIIYRIEKTRILIITVIHGSRDIAQQQIKPWEIA